MTMRKHRTNRNFKNWANFSFLHKSPSRLDTRKCVLILLCPCVMK